MTGFLTWVRTGPNVERPGQSPVPVATVAPPADVFSVALPATLPATFA